MDTSKLDELDAFLSGIEKRAFRIALIATGMEDEALDIVQDSMLKLAQKYSHKPDTEWPPLFHRILQTKIRDWYRRQAVRNQWRVFFGPTEDDDADFIEQARDYKTPGSVDHVNQHRAMASLEKALHQLPLRQQQAFLLRAWEGLDVAETAAAMECTQGSVKTHYSRAVHRLRELLEDFQ
ncbi:MAG: RNA polymerase sigma factor [Gammaproteobacteria bacterium]|nr:RNA polymerase sigma factor [Gammaproteobacteria bacterium]